MPLDDDGFDVMVSVEGAVRLARRLLAASGVEPRVCDCCRVAIPQRSRTGLCRDCRDEEEYGRTCGYAKREARAAAYVMGV